MRDMRSARATYLMQQCEKIGILPGGRQELLPWINSRLNEEPSDLGDPALGNKAMEKILAEYPEKLKEGIKK